MPAARPFRLRFLLIPPALLLIGIPSLWLFMSLTATPIHPKADAVPSVSRLTPPPQWAPTVDRTRQLVRAAIVEQNLPGVSVAVATGGDLVWAEGFGYAAIFSNTTVTPEHRFRIGTASNVLSATAAGRLVESGRLNLSGELQTYVPAFPRKEQPITLRQVMSHTAGIVNDGGDESTLFHGHCKAPAEAIPHFAENRLLFEPGTQFRPSRYGYILVSAAIESAANQPFLSYMKEQIFQPAGMRDTTFDGEIIEPESEDFPLFTLIRELFWDPGATPGTNPNPNIAANQVISYFPRFSADPKYGFHMMRPLDLSCYSGAGAFVSTPSDLVRFALAVQGGKLVQPATLTALQTPLRLPSGEETRYGLGWSRRMINLGDKPTPAFGHNGDLLGGQVATLLTFPDHGLAVAVVSNTSYADTYGVATQIAQAFASSK